MNWMWPMVLTNLLVAFAASSFLVRQSTSVVWRTAKVPIVCLGGVSIWIFLQALGVWDFSSWDQQATWVGLLKTWTYAGTFCLALFLIRTRDQLETLLWVIVAAGACQVLITIALDQTGTYVNRNHFAGYMEISLAVAIGLMLSKFDRVERGNWRASLRGWIRVFLGPKIVIRVLIIILVIGLIVSRSRMGNLGFFVGLGIAGLIGLWTFRSVGRKVMIFFGSLLAIDVFLIGAFYGIDKLQARFEQLDSSLNLRTFLNEHSWLALQDHWLFGSGVGSYYAVYPSVRDHLTFGHVQHAHNDYAQFFVEFGIGSILLAMFVVYSAYTAIRVQVVRKSRFMRAVGFASLMAIISLMFHATAEFNFQLTANASTFMVVLALPYLALTLDRRSGA
ncbi:MAG: O-antigen ligase family protein [Pseudomonadales bacterium]|nr:O-antigen ligase family protein [Pseudomonadales bacterium]